jgi:hypothetical protein
MLMRKIFMPTGLVQATFIKRCKKSCYRFFIIELFPLIGLAAHAHNKVMAVIPKEILSNKIKLLSSAK